MQRFLQDRTDDEFLTHCYRFLLSREPDAEGKAHHLNALYQGLSRDALIQAFVQSDEFASSFNRFDSTSANASVQAKPAGKFVPDGHFYSPFPAAEDHEDDYAIRVLDTPDGIAVNEEGQLQLANALKPFYDALPFTRERSDKHRYFLDNGAFNYFDGIVLHCLIRMLKPRRIIEVGSGFSSAAMMDTCELYLDGKTEITFIEPYPETLYGCMRPGDQERYTVIDQKVQDVPLDVFRALQKNDILFIDSSHVSKFGSDVNHLFFKVLPLLQDGVVIHVHDIFRHFDYPQEWLREGRAWSEGYLLKAFLASNRDYTIRFFNDWFAHHHWTYLEQNMPLCTVQPAGSPFKNSGVSLWLQKTMQDGQRV